MRETVRGEQLCMDMGRAVTDCIPRPVAQDVWTQVARHGPGQRKGKVSTTNRSIVYRLRPEGGTPFLVLVNGLWVDEGADQPFAGLRALERETACPLRFILAPGAAHHLSLSLYAKAFPEARVCVAAGRIPRTNPTLVALDNVEVYPIDAPPPELAAAGLRVRVLGGLMEGPGARRVAAFTGGGFGCVCDSTEPLMICHLPSGCITSGGHQWWFVAEGRRNAFDMPAPMRFVLRLMGIGIDYMRPGQIVFDPNHNFAIHDRAALQASCSDVLSWDFDTLLDLHAPPDSCPRGNARDLLEPVLAPLAEGRWDEVSWRDGVLPR